MSEMHLVWSDPALGTLALNSGNGILVEKFDPGWPDVRESTIDRPDAHGIIDDTQFYGSRTCTIEGMWMPSAGRSRHDIRQAVGKFLLPGNRFTMQWQVDPSDPILEVTARIERGSFSMVSIVDQFTISLRIDTFWQDSEVRESSASWTGSTPLSGDPWPWLDSAPTSGGIDFEDGINSSGIIDNAGVAPIYPVITLFGHIPNPVIANSSTGKLLQFTGLNLLESQSLVVDMKNRTAVVDGATNAFPFVDFSVSSWWQAVPGNNWVTLSCASGAPSGSNAPTAIFTWHDLYL